MFENISVIPLYISVLKITDSKIDMTWEEQVYFGTSFSKASESAFMAAREEWPETVTELKAVVRHYHLCNDGTMRYIMETEA